MNFAIDVGASLAALFMTFQAYNAGYTLLWVGCLSVALYFIFTGIWDILDNFR